jgi:hypothetical protein
MKSVASIGCGPEYLTHARRKQGLQLPYPEGEVDFIVMSRVKGETLGNTCNRL